MSCNKSFHLRTKMNPYKVTFYNSVQDKPYCKTSDYNAKGQRIHLDNGPMVQRSRLPCQRTLKSSRNSKRDFAWYTK